MKTLSAHYMLVIMLLFSGCNSTGQNYQDLSIGKHSISTNWLTYPEDGYGFMAGVGYHENDIDLLNPYQTGHAGVQVGVTRKLNENFGVHLGLGLTERETESDSNSLAVAGLHYWIDPNTIVGIRHNSATDDVTVSLGFDNPYWLISTIAVWNWLKWQYPE